MADKKTTVSLEFHAKGAEKSERQIKKTFDAMDPSEAMEKFDKLADKLEDLGKVFKRLENSADLKGMTDSIRDMTHAVVELTNAKKKDHEQDERSAGRHSFRTGLVQGAGVGQFIPPNVRMARYAGGQLVGRAARGAAGAAYGSTIGAAFGGAGAMGQGLAGIPGVGPALAGQFQNLMGAAQEALSHEGARYAQRETEGLFTGPARRAAARVAGDAAAAAAPQEDVFAAMDAARKGASTSEGKLGAAGESYNARLAAMVQHRMVTEGFPEKRPSLGPGVSYDKRRTEIEYELNRTLQAKGEGSNRDMENIVRAAGQAATDRNEAAKAKARSEAASPASPFQMMARAGVRFGMGPDAAVEFGGSLARAGGGTLAQFDNTNMQLAMALKQLGVGPEATGMMARGARTGATGEGDFTSVMMASMKGGVALGLDASDLANYMQDMAHNIASWDQTGMSVNVDNIKELQQQTAMTGLGGIQGARVAAGLKVVGDEIAVGGPQSASQMLMMRELYGYQGGGIEDWQAAKVRAEVGDLTKGSGVEGLLRTVMGQAGDGTGPATQAARTEALQNFFKNVNITLGPTLAGRIAGGDEGAVLRVQEELRAARSKSVTEADVLRAGEATGALQEEAVVKGKRITAGYKGLPAMQELEHATTTMLKNASAFGGILDTLAGVGSDIAELLGPGAKNLAMILEDLARRTGLGTAEH